MKENIFDVTEKILKSSSKYTTNDNKLLKNQVLEDAQKMDAELLELMLSDETTKQVFFKKVNEIFVFDKVKFSWVLNNKNFLPDSYTRYQNKIGFGTADGYYLSASNDIQLLFPYKDCVLEGGQTKEDQNKNEIFYNELLAPLQVSNLLAPKAFCNAKKFDKDGVHNVSEISGKDNLVIKGNNLLTISSLKKVYENNIKLVYIDVPYNTGNDSFKYNDKFNHSSWLLFIKNRLDIAYQLLDRSGTIAVSVDNYELAYMMVLLDEVFGKENRKNVITIRRASVSGAKVINPGVVNIVEYVIIYAKDSSYWKPNRIFAAKGYDDRYSSFIKNINEPYDNWVFTSVLEAFSTEKRIPKNKLKSELGNDYDSELENFVIKNSESVVQFASLNDSQISAESLELKKKSLAEPQKIFYQKREGYKDYYLLNGHVILFAKDRIMNIDGRKTFSTPVSDIWDDVLPNDIHNEGGVELKKGKKPEKLISRIIELCTNEGDIVLDFFAGSGTTGAVCLKMNRQFILCEQMDYIEDTTCKRLENVISGENRGVSTQYGWQGGGSFVYCELAKLNQNFVDKINECKTDEEISRLINEIAQSDFVSTKVNPKDINTEIKEFKDLSFDEKRNFAMEILDKNQLYVNKSERNDPDMNLSENDIAFTNSFYGDK